MLESKQSKVKQFYYLHNLIVFKQSIKVRYLDYLVGYYTMYRCYLKNHKDNFRTFFL